MAGFHTTSACAQGVVARQSAKTTTVSPLGPVRLLLPDNREVELGTVKRGARQVVGDIAPATRHAP